MKTISIPIDERTGKPLVTSAMKAECIAEFSFQREIACPACCYESEETEQDSCALCNGSGEYTEKLVIPWDTCKEIYKAMAIEAAKGL